MKAHTVRGSQGKKSDPRPQPEGLKRLLSGIDAGLNEAMDPLRSTQVICGLKRTGLVAKQATASVSEGIKTSLAQYQNVSLPYWHIYFAVYPLKHCWPSNE